MAPKPSDPPPAGVPAEPSAGAVAGERSVEIARLFREHNRTLVGLLVTRLKNEQEAREVAQEAYVKVLQLEARAGAVSYLRSYLFRVAENLAIDRLRHRQVRTRIERLDSMEDFFEDARAERTVIAEQEVARLGSIVAELPASCREAFRLHKLADYPFDKVAQFMGLKERMVRRYVARALAYICLRCEGHEPKDAWKQVMS